MSFSQFSPCHEVNKAFKAWISCAAAATIRQQLLWGLIICYLCNVKICPIMVNDKSPLHICCKMFVPFFKMFYTETGKFFSQNIDNVKSRWSGPNVSIIVVVASHANPFVRDQNQFDFWRSFLCQHRWISYWTFFFY